MEERFVMDTFSAPWDLEERVEDAIVAYLKTGFGGGLVCAAGEYVLARFPMVVVEALESNNVTEDEEFTGARKLDVNVVVETEFQSDEQLKTARQRHREAKTAVLKLLAGRLLHERLNELTPEGVGFSMAQMAQQTSETGIGRRTTLQVLSVIAQPKEIE
jgi:hypothetical protein